MSIPSISAVLCTRDRGELAVATVKSILANTHDDFELVVVDQSKSDQTAREMRVFLADPRVRYFRSESRGLSQARNEGLALATGDLVAFTDDDCTVPAGWLAGLERIFSAHADVVVAFCNVTAGPHDPSEGFVPDYLDSKDVVIRSPRALTHARGMGAGMAVRRDAILAIGGFDQQLGSGADLRSGEDRDIALRAIWHGDAVFETSTVEITHHGFRTWAEGRELARRDWTGLGAAYVKVLRRRDWRNLWLIVYEILVCGLIGPLSDLARLERPKGLGRSLYFARGLLAGLRLPLDRSTMAYEPWHWDVVDLPREQSVEGPDTARDESPATVDG